MEADTFNTEKIIQIELFQYKKLATKKLVQKIEIGLFILLLIGTITYYYFNVGFTIILLIASLLTIVFSFLLLRLTDYSTTDNMTLIIAFGEIQLMEDKQIISQENINHLDFENSPFSSYQIPILTIKGLTFPEISIGYGRPKNSDTNSKQPIDYLIYSKLDWQILQYHTKPNSLKEHLKLRY